MFHKMDLSLLTDDDLTALLESMRKLATGTGNRVALDLFCVVEAETLRRHVHTRIADYRDDELHECVECFAAAIDAAITGGMPADYPAVVFLRYALTAAIEELRQRGLVAHRLQ